MLHPQRALGLTALACLVSSAVLAQPTSQNSVTVNGRPLVGLGVFAESRGGKSYIPVVAIAEALGDEVIVDATTRTVTVRRRSGVRAELRAATGEVLENGVPVLVSAASDVFFTADPRGLLLPVELVSALLDASIVVDPTSRSIRVTRDVSQIAVTAGEERTFVEMYQGRYAYNANVASESFNHSLNLDGTGRIYDGLLNMTANLSGSAQQGLVDYRYGLVSYRRPNGQHLMAGDVTSAGDLRFLATTVRGLWYRQNIASFDVTAFGGMVQSGALSDPLAAIREDLGYDTTVVGSYFTLGRQWAGSGAHVESSTGGMWFSGPNRNAGLLNTSLVYETAVHAFRAELGLGTFEQLQLDGTRKRQTGLLLEATESLTPTDALTLLAGVTHVPETFVAPHSGASLRPMTMLTGGASWRAAPWLTTTVAGRHTERLDRPQRPTDWEVAATAAVSPSGTPWPSLTVAHTEGEQSELGHRSSSLVSLSKNFGTFDASANFSRYLIGANGPQYVLGLSGGARLGDLGAVRAVQSFTRAGGLSGGIDFLIQSFFSKNVSVGAGVGYTYDGANLSADGRLNVRARLPGNHALQLSVTQTQFGANAFVELSGALFERPAAAHYSNVGIDELSKLGEISGRVFQDVDLDGLFDPSKDRPLGGVRVLVDGSNAFVTEEDGRYRMTNILAGPHKVYLDVLTVRADLSMLQGASREILLLPERDAVIDFSLVRTGRVSGYVWQDVNGNGEYEEDEPGLGGVRVVVGPRDTLTSSSGDFVIGDLPQGQHTVALDLKTLPEGMVPAITSTEVTVTPPRETRGVKLPMTVKPVEIEIREF